MKLRSPNEGFQGGPEYLESLVKKDCQLRLEQHLTRESFSSMAGETYW